MNISIPGYSENTPTLFNIQVCIERATFQVRKRYSDFVDFAAKIEQEMGERPPVDLPGKKWIGNKSREFLDQRRRGLERYLRSLAKHEEWRESLAFQQFLEISKHVRPGDKHHKVKADWLKGTQEAREYIQQAMRANGGAEERRFIVLAGAKISDLEATLAGDSDLGDGEYRRRRDTIQEMMRALLSLKSQQHGIPGSFDSGIQSDSALFASQDASWSSERPHAKVSTPRVLGKGGETDRTRNKDNEGLLQLQRDDMGQQDQMIDYLRQVIQRQRQLGEEINEELIHQNELLDQLDDDTHAVNARLNQARRRVGKLG